MEVEGSCPANRWHSLRHVAAREEVLDKEMNGTRISEAGERHLKKSIRKKFWFHPSDQSSEAELKTLSVKE